MNSTGEIVSKVCTDCTANKPIKDFAKQKGGLGGLQSKCRACKALYKQSVRERTKKVSAIYRANNPDRIKEQSREYYTLNKEVLLEKSRKWSKENRKRMSEHSRNYARRNPEKVAETLRSWKARNPEYNKEYHELNRDSRRVANREWQRANPEKVLLKYHRRRARKLALPDTFTSAQLDETLSHFNGGCVLTGDSSAIHWDHVIPLASEHAGTIHGNMIPLRADLNGSKSDANIYEWFEANRQRFELSQERFDALINWLADVNGMTTEEYREYVYACHSDVSITKSKRCKSA